ncbi:MAG: RNB domain-containing ribonuclease [Ilumatobacteraceae bacterium]
MQFRSDATEEMQRGLDDIRASFDVPGEFPAEVVAAAEAAAARPLGDEHVDRTAWEFVTLDPAASKDLDQAFHIEMDGEVVVLHYAIADVDWFVQPGDAVDVEAWKRGVTIYLPDRRARLYPEVLSEGAASLLPDEVRPAYVFTVRIAADGGVTLAGCERAAIRSRAKLAYDAVTPEQLPDGFDELSRRIVAAEDARGAPRRASRAGARA